jgi:hypothetical protein
MPRKNPAIAQPKTPRPTLTQRVSRLEARIDEAPSTPIAATQDPADAARFSKRRAEDEAHTSARLRTSMNILDAINDQLDPANNGTSAQKISNLATLAYAWSQLQKSY